MHNEGETCNLRRASARNRFCHWSFCAEGGIFGFEANGFAEIGRWMNEAIPPILFTMICVFPASLSLHADEPKQETPRIAVSAPLSAHWGATTKLLIRGWKLDSANELQTTPPTMVKILNKGKAAIPAGQDVKFVGDSQMEVELTVPADLAGEELSLRAVSADGPGEEHRLLLGGATNVKPNLPPLRIARFESSLVVNEVEPNDGFRQAQPIQPVQVIDGQIQSDRDVDLFVFTAEAGQTAICEVLAHRRGSALDSLLTLYSEDRQVLAENDDLPAESTEVRYVRTTDSRIEFALPKTGRDYLALQDAHDHGGPAHPYRLCVRVIKN